MMTRPFLPVPAKTSGTGGRPPEFCQFIGDSLPNITSSYKPVTTKTFLGCADNNVVIPPNASGAVSPNQVLTTTNTVFQVQDRLGNILFSESINQFATNGGLTYSNIGDCTSFYDEFNNRFVFCASLDYSTATSRMLVAVSQTASALPSSGWYFYTQLSDSGGAHFCDFPSIGSNSQWIVVSANLYTVATTPVFTSACVWVLNMAAAYAGTNTSTYITSTQIPALVNASTMRPARMHDTYSTTMYLVDNSMSYNSLRISTITGPVNAPYLNFGLTNTSPNTISWGSSTGLNNWGFELGGTSSTDVTILDDRMVSVEYRNGYLYTCATVGFPASSPTFASIMFCQIIASTGVLAQQVFLNNGGSGGTSTSWAFPSVAVNTNGDVLIGFTLFDVHSYPSAAYVFQAATDPAGTFQLPSVFQPGLGFYNKIYSPDTRNRWGDVSMTQVDPVNGVDFWTFQEYAALPTSQSEWACGFAQVALLNPVVTPTPTIVISYPTPSVTKTATPTTTMTPVPSSSSALSAGAIAGIVIGALAAIALIVGLCVGLLRKKKVSPATPTKVQEKTRSPVKSNRGK